jgi:hypothetical protein
MNAVLIFLFLLKMYEFWIVIITIVFLVYSDLAPIPAKATHTNVWLGLSFGYKLFAYCRLIPISLHILHLTKFVKACVNWSQPETGWRFLLRWWVFYKSNR